MIKRALAVAAAAALPLTLAALPANATIPADGVKVDGAGFIETKTVKDDGGVPYTISVDWNYLYRDAAGVLRVSVNPLVIYRNDSDVLAAGEPEDAGVDVHFDVINPSGYFVQHVVRDNVDLDFAADNQASFNPRNPKHGYAKVRVRVGTDGDGLGSSDFVYFTEPLNIGPKPAS